LRYVRNAEREEKMTVQDAKMKLLDALCGGLFPESDFEPLLGDAAEDYPDNVIEIFDKAKAELLNEFQRRIARHNMKTPKGRQA